MNHRLTNIGWHVILSNWSLYFFPKAIRYLAFFVNDEFVDHHPTRSVSHESNGRHKNGVAVSVGKGTGWIAPRKTNMPPEECWLEDEIPFEVAPFQVTCYFLGVYLLGSANEWSDTSMPKAGSRSQDWAPQKSAKLVNLVFPGSPQTFKTMGFHQMLFFL